MNRQFSRNEKQMAGKHIKSIQLTHHQRNASKNYFRFYFTLVKMEVIKKKINNNKRMWTKGSPNPLLLGA